MDSFYQWLQSRLDTGWLDYYCNMRTFIKKTLNLLLVALAVFLSRTLWVTVGGLYVVWLVHWSDVTTLYSLTDPDQLKAFTQLALCRYGLIASIVMGYLGFTKSATGIAGYVIDRLKTDGDT